MSGGFHNLIGWGLLALYAATTSLCHLAHDPVAHGAGCCTHGADRTAKHAHAAQRSACHHAFHHHHGAYHDGGRDHSSHDHLAHDDQQQSAGHQHPDEDGHARDQSPSCSDSPSHDGHTCAVCQYLADPSLTVSAVVTLAPTGVIEPAPTGDPLHAPRTVLRSYSSRAPPRLLA